MFLSLASFFKRMTCILLPFFIFSNIQSVLATHVTGIELSYRCISQNMYSINLEMYRNCNGINMQSSRTISWTGSCGNGTITVNRIKIEEMPQICPGQSSCSGGSGFLGREAHTYTGVTILFFIPVSIVR